MNLGMAIGLFITISALIAFAIKYFSREIEILIEKYFSEKLNFFKKQKTVELNIEQYNEINELIEQYVHVNSTENIFLQEKIFKKLNTFKEQNLLDKSYYDILKEKAIVKQIISRY